MIVITYNMRRVGVDSPHWGRLIDELGADLVLAQESGSPADAATGASASRFVWRPAGANRWGSAVYARCGRVRPLPLGDWDGWAIAADVPHPWRRGRRLVVVSVHVPSGPGGYVGQTGRLLDALVPAAAGRELLVGGDFNFPISPGGGVRTDTPRERAMRTRLAEEIGLLNCWAAANPDAVPPQTLRWAGNPVAPYHCDGLFAPRRWADRLAGCRVPAGPDWDRLSDHNPVVAEFNCGPPATGRGRLNTED